MLISMQIFVIYFYNEYGDIIFPTIQKTSITTISNVIISMNSVPFNIIMSQSARTLQQIRTDTSQSKGKEEIGVGRGRPFISRLTKITTNGLLHLTRWFAPQDHRQISESPPTGLSGPWRMSSTCLIISHLCFLLAYSPGNDKPPATAHLSTAYRSTALISRLIRYIWKTS